MVTHTAKSKNRGSACNCRHHTTTRNMISPHQRVSQHQRLHCFVGFWTSESCRTTRSGRCWGGSLVAQRLRRNLHASGPFLDQQRRRMDLSATPPRGVLVRWNDDGGPWEMGSTWPWAVPCWGYCWRQDSVCTVGYLFQFQRGMSSTNVLIVPCKMPFIGPE